VRPLLAALCLIAALGLGACTQSSSVSDFTGTEADVAQAVEDLESDGEHGEAARICSDLLTTDLQQAVAADGESCAAELDKALEDADSFDLEVEDVTVTGSTATARVSGATEGDDVVRTFELTKDGTRWRISSFGAG